MRRPSLGPVWLARGRQPLQLLGTDLSVTSERGTGSRSRKRPLGGVGDLEVRTTGGWPRPLVSSALGSLGLLRAGSLRKGGASARAPNVELPR